MNLDFVIRCGGGHWNIRTKIKLLKTSSTNFLIQGVSGGIVNILGDGSMD